ncbi:gamma-glutamyltransferase [Caballeronia sordidicola]|uniref:Gamma-glutamyltransferase n=1 Tax=Caballeronia sordidicola TaxID=196367 RepID=A0A158HPW5_CABSO|nr:gamma-glutamyltransferase family protein [Caballeronia sordidicola]SAL46107.1 gamma-glutamyltransferase [Caballeronia sordidicola]
MASYVTPTFRPLISSSKFSVSAGHYLAAQAGMRILHKGGNAIDAGVAAGICINVTQPDLTNFGGVAPIIIYLAKTQEVVTISGLGRWPKKATLEHFRDELGGDIPLGVKNAIVPSACDAWLTALARFGTMTVADVLEPALELATDGYPVSPLMSHMLVGVHQNIQQWPSSREYVREDGKPFQPGDTIRQPTLARTFRALIDTERAASSRGRADAIMAARDLFYKGEIAEKMARFSREQGGFLDYDDLAEFAVAVEPAVKTRYRGYDVYACGPWCQGPVVPQTLNILEHFDLASYGHNSPESLHLIIEALKASFSDRHAFYGDPDFVDVPINGLLNKEYARDWAGRILMNAAWNEMPQPGDPWKYEGRSPGAMAQHEEPKPGPLGTDTSCLSVVDAEGNGFSATPSDGVRYTPVVPDVGVVLSPRGYQSWLDPRHPSSLAPGKRPRLTPNPGLMLKDGKLAMVFGTPGLDVQPQAMTQLIVNVVDYGMDPQRAIEAPRVATFNFPETQHPHHYNPGALFAEGRIADATFQALSAKGHRPTKWPDFIATAGALCAIRVGSEHGRLAAGADPRRTAYAMGW